MYVCTLNTYTRLDLTINERAAHAFAYKRTSTNIIRGNVQTMTARSRFYMKSPRGSSQNHRMISVWKFTTIGSACTYAYNRRRRSLSFPDESNGHSRSRWKVQRWMDRAGRGRSFPVKLSGSRIPISGCRVFHRMSEQAIPTNQWLFHFRAMGNVIKKYERRLANARIVFPPFYLWFQFDASVKIN